MTVPQQIIKYIRLASYMSTANQTTLTDAITTVLRPAPCAMTKERIERLT